MTAPEAAAAMATTLVTDTTPSTDQVDLPSTTLATASTSSSAGNVVAYTAVLSVQNPDLNLRPGMTATATLALAIGAGAETRQPLGLAVVGGLILSQALTLYITPVFYLFMEDLRSLGGKMFR